MSEFVAPTSAVRRSFVRAAAEFEAEGVTGSQTAEWIAAFGASWEEPHRFEEFVAFLVADSLEGTARTSTRVPTTTLWWVDGDDYVGRLAIRHRLNEQLLETGGHIGYDVRPSRRREGHATAMLRAALPVARSLGIERALVTCDADNVASQKVIEAAGGDLEDQRGPKLRFWVPTVLAER